MLTYNEMLPHSTPPKVSMETRYEENTGGCMLMAISVAVAFGFFCGLMFVWVMFG